MKVLHDLLIGIGHDPRVVAAFRAFVLYVLPIAVEAAIGYLTHHVGPGLVGVVGVTAMLMRALEGAVIDYLQKPNQNIAPVDHISA
jgi:hypothetical protein